MTDVTSTGIDALFSEGRTYPPPEALGAAGDAPPAGN
jgi:hypothetical protein